MNRRIVGRTDASRLRCACCAIALALLLTDSANGQQKSLPNWGGWWGLQEPATAELRRAPAPLKPELFEAMQKTATSDAGGFRELSLQTQAVHGLQRRFCGKRRAVVHSRPRHTYERERPYPANLYRRAIATRRSGSVELGYVRRSLGGRDACGRDDRYRSSGTVSRADRGCRSDRAQRKDYGAHIPEGRGHPAVRNHDDGARDFHSAGQADATV